MHSFTCKWNQNFYLSLPTLKDFSIEITFWQTAPQRVTTSGFNEDGCHDVSLIINDFFATVHLKMRKKWEKVSCYHVERCSDDERFTLE